jgi:hypothetical protein
VRYVDDARRLARAVVELLAAGPAPGGFLPDREHPAALAARDALAQELRDLIAGVLGAVAQGGPASPDMLLTSPTHALHAALHDLPHSAGVRLPLSEVFLARAGPLTRAWQDTARAAVVLERYRDLLPTLGGQDAWSVARDAADLAATLTHLDADLAAALPPYADAARVALLHPDAHGLVRLAAAELLAQTADLTPGSAQAAVADHLRIRPVRTVKDLPAATATLGLLLQRRGAALTVGETRATARALAQGFELADQVLLHTGLRGSPTATAAKQLREAIPPLRQLFQEPAATLTPPSPAVLHLTHQIREGLDSVAFLIDRPDHREGQDATAVNRARLAGPMTQWTLEALDVAAALHHGLQQAAASGRLLEPRRGQGRPDEQHLLWRRPIQGAYVNPPPAVRAAAQAAAVLDDVRVTLASGGLSRARQAAAERDAALRAGSAFGDLRAALQARPPRQLPNPARPHHPALPPPAGHRRLRPSR